MVFLSLFQTYLNRLMAEDTVREVDKVRNTPGLLETEMQSKVEDLERQCVSVTCTCCYILSVL